MESTRQMKRQPVSSSAATSSFEAKLKDVIDSRLQMLSEESREKVLDYINSLIDMEQKQLEFNRRQGRLYHWLDSEEPQT
jgi:hypothetical protein